MEARAPRNGENSSGCSDTAASARARASKAGPMGVTEAQRSEKAKEVQSPEDRAWELLLAIAGAHAEGPKGSPELRRLAMEARQLLLDFPVKVQPPGWRTWVGNSWSGLKVALGTVWGLLTLVVSVCHDVVSILVLAATGKAEEAEPAEDSAAEPRAPSQPKARGRTTKMRKQPRGPSAAKASAPEDEQEEEEEEEARGCCLS
ncbi:ANP2 [Symbiodinium microadriaticum]|nr:ANP2 [Symbiodinium microadriaticum]